MRIVVREELPEPAQHRLGLAPGQVAGEIGAGPCGAGHANDPAAGAARWLDHVATGCKRERAVGALPVRLGERWRRTATVQPSVANAMPRAAGKSVPPIRCPPAQTPTLWRAELRVTTALRKWAVDRLRLREPGCVRGCPRPVGTGAHPSAPPSRRPHQAPAAALRYRKWPCLGTSSPPPAADD